MLGNCWSRLGFFASFHFWEIAFQTVNLWYLSKFQYARGKKKKSYIIFKNTTHDGIALIANKQCWNDTPKVAIFDRYHFNCKVYIHIPYFFIEYLNILRLLYLCLFWYFIFALHNFPSSESPFASCMYHIMILINTSVLHDLSFVF